MYDYDKRILENMGPPKTDFQIKERLRLRTLVKKNLETLTTENSIKYLFPNPCPYPKKTLDATYGLFPWIGLDD